MITLMQRQIKINMKALCSMQHAPNINNLTANTQINHNPTNTNTPDCNQVNNNLQDKTDPLDITPPNTNNHHNDISIATTDHNQQENIMQHALNTDTESNFNPSNTQNTNNPTNTNTSDSNQAIPPHLLTPFQIIYTLKLKLNKLGTNLEQLQEHKITKTLPPGLQIHHKSKLQSPTQDGTLKIKM